MAILTAFPGCMPAVRNVGGPSSPEQQAYLDSVRSDALTFDLPAADSEAAWARATVWLAEHSSMKIQTATPNLLDTYRPVFEVGGLGTIDISYGYTVTRQPVGDKVRFSVKCIPTDSYYKKDLIDATAAANARILARAIRTGEKAPEGLIKK